MKNVFIKYNNYRNKEFNVITQIFENDNSKFVIKRAQNNDSIPHVDRINNAVELFRKNVVSNKYIIPSMERIDSKTLKMSYIEGQTYEAMLLSRLQVNDIDGFKKLILDYKQWLLSTFVTKDSDKFLIKDTDGLGYSVDITVKDKYYGFAPLDLIFSNLIINDKGVNIIDQEWTYSFNTPVSYVLYRSIFYFYINNQSAIRDKVNIGDILKEVDIEEGICNDYRELELSFQNMVRGSYFKKMAEYKKPAFTINEKSLSEIKNVEQTARLHFKDSVVFGKYQKRNGRYEYSWNNIVLEGMVRIKLAAPFSCFVITGIRFKDNTNIYRSVTDFQTNSVTVVNMFDLGQIFYSGKEIPLIEFELKRFNIKELVIDLEILSQGEQDSNRLISFGKMYNDVRFTKHYRIYNKLKNYYYNIKPFINFRCLKELFVEFMDNVKNCYIGKFKFYRTVKRVYDGVSKKHNKICLFASYDPDSNVREYVKYYIKKLAQLDYDLVFITSSESINDDDIKFLLSKCTKVIHRTNVGYDFGSWATGYRLLKDNIKKSEQLLLANDSVFGPINELKGMMDCMNEKGLDAWGCTDSYERSYHLQSYFINFNKNVVRSDFLDDFLRNYTVFKKKADIINKYEVGLSKKLLKRGYKIGAYCNYKDVASYMYWNGQDHPSYGYSMLFVNSTHYFWDVLVNEFNFPFIKKELLVKNPVNIKIKGNNYIKALNVRSMYDFSLINSFIGNK